MLAAQPYFADSQDVTFGMVERRIGKRLNVIFAIRILLGLMEMVADFFLRPQLWQAIFPAFGVRLRRGVLLY
jgi:hypothetical protein